MVGYQDTTGFIGRQSHRKVKYNDYSSTLQNTAQTRMSLLIGNSSAVRSEMQALVSNRARKVDVGNWFEDDNKRFLVTSTNKRLI